MVAKHKQYDAELTRLNHVKSTDMNKSQLARLAKLNQQDAALNTIQAHRYIEEGRSKLKDTMADLDRQHKEAMTEGGLDTVESQYRKGRSAVEQRLKGEKGALGAAYEPILKKALANFDLTFNVPLKKIEENIKNLELGSAADNVIEAARLSFQAVREKLREQAEAFRKSGGKTGIAPGQAHELLAERQRDYIADLAKAGPELQQFIGENMIRRIQQQQELATTLPNAQRNLAQTRLQGQEFEAGLNPRNANVMARAERIVGLEQPRIGLDEAERMVRQKIELEREGQRAAMVQATSSLEAAKVQTTYVIPAMMALAESAYKNKLPGMNKAAEEATAAIRSMTAGLTKPGSGKGASDHKATSDAEPAKAGAHGATSAGGGHHVTVNVAPKASLTMNDINALLPQIKDALCRQAAISGSRG